MTRGEWDLVNSLMALLRDLDVPAIVKEHYDRLGNAAPAELLRPALTKVQHLLLYPATEGDLLRAAPPVEDRELDVALDIYKRLLTDRNWFVAWVDAGYGRLAAEARKAAAALLKPSPLAPAGGGELPAVPPVENQLAEPGHMICNEHRGWCVYRCPCGAEFSTRSRLDPDPKDWLDLHRPHTSGHILWHAVYDRRADTLGDFPPPAKAAE